MKWFTQNYKNRVIFLILSSGIFLLIRLIEVAITILLFAYLHDIVMRDRK